MPFPPYVFTTGSWPKSDINPVPVGLSASYFAARDAADVSGALTASKIYIDALSASLSVALNDKTSDDLAAGFPVSAYGYTASYSGALNLLIGEVWIDAGTGFKIKSSSYVYASGVVTQSFVTRFNPADGTTILAQGTSTFYYTTGVLASESFVRTV